MPPDPNGSAGRHSGTCSATQSSFDLDMFTLAVPPVARRERARRRRVDPVVHRRHRYGVPGVDEKILLRPEGQHRPSGRAGSAVDRRGRARGDRRKPDLHSRLPYQPATTTRVICRTSRATGSAAGACTVIPHRRPRLFRQRMSSAVRNGGHFGSGRWPAQLRRAAHVTMLQRSPSSFAGAVDKISEVLGRFLPDRWSLSWSGATSSSESFTRGRRRWPQADGDAAVEATPGCLRL